VTTDLLIADVSRGNASALSRVRVECIIGATITFPPSEALGYVQREVEVAVEDAAQHDPLRPHRLFLEPSHELCFRNTSGEISDRCVVATG
jgi:hypothetical protein